LQPDALGTHNIVLQSIRGLMSTTSIYVDLRVGCHLTKNYHQASENILTCRKRKFSWMYVLRAGLCQRSLFRTTLRKMLLFCKSTRIHLFSDLATSFA